MKAKTAILAATLALPISLPVYAQNAPLPEIIKGYCEPAAEFSWEGLQLEKQRRFDDFLYRLIPAPRLQDAVANAIQHGGGDGYASTQYLANWLEQHYGEVLESRLYVDEPIPRERYASFSRDVILLYGRALP